MYADEAIGKSQVRGQLVGAREGTACREQTVQERLMERASNLRAEAHRMESLARELNMQALSPDCAAHLGNLIGRGMRDY